MRRRFARIGEHKKVGGIRQRAWGSDHIADKSAIWLLADRIITFQLRCSVRLSARLSQSLVEYVFLLDNNHPNNAYRRSERRTTVGSDRYWPIERFGTFVRYVVTTPYVNYAMTVNHSTAHYDLGAGGSGVTTDCHDAANPDASGFDPNGGAPHCSAGGRLQGISAGIKYIF